MSDRCSLPILLLALCLGLPAFTLAAEGLADPTRPPQVATSGNPSAPVAEALPRWELQGILFGDDRRVAVINGRSLTEKGRLGKATVVRIEADKVLLRYQDKMVTLKLPRVEGAHKRNHKLEGKLNP